MLLMLISPPSISTRTNTLIRPLKRRHSLALVLVQRSANDSPVAQINLAVWCLLEGERVLHPVLVVPIWEIFTCMSTTRFFAVSSGHCSLSPVITLVDAHKGWSD